MVNQIAIPTYSILSTEIRRDLQDPLRFFSNLKITHYYRKASKDLSAGELDQSVKYSSPFDLYRKLALNPPDLIQGVEPFALVTIPYIIAGWFYSRKNNIPLVVVSPENRPLNTKYGAVGGYLLRCLLVSYFKDADICIYLNNGAKYNFDSCHVPEEKMVRLMYGTWGVTLNEFNPHGYTHKVDGFEKYILFVGRIIESKGIFDLVDAFKFIHHQIPDTCLLIVGDGPDQDELKKHILGKGMEKLVRFFGFALNRDLPPIFRGASIFVSPSVTTRWWEEQIGMTNLQAMACGVPIVSTMSGAIPEYVINGETGLLVPEHQPLALSQAILRLLLDTEFSISMGTAGRIYAEKYYDPRKNISKIENILLKKINHAI